MCVLRGDKCLCTHLLEMLNNSHNIEVSVESLSYIKCYVKRLENEDCITDINAKMQHKKRLVLLFPGSFSIQCNS